MNKLKIRPYFAKTKLFMYALLSISFYLLYALINTLRGITTKEGMFNARSLTGQILCREDKCMEGCKEPTKITEKCGQTIYRDLQNKCYKLCPYTCSEKGDGCISNDCCVGCSKKKFEVPCDELIAKGADPGISTDGRYAPVFVTGYANIEENPRATKLAIDIYHMMNDVSNVYDKHKGELLNTNEYDCAPNITGTFTECGPAPSLHPKYQ